VIPQVPDWDLPVRTLAQIVDSDSWKTTIVLVNSGADLAPFSIAFWQPTGDPLQIPLAGPGPVTEYADVIPPGGVRFVESESRSSTLAQGWAEIVGSKAIGGTLIFRQRGNAADSEAGIPIAQPLGQGFMLPFDNTLGFMTGLAVLNPDSTQPVTTLVTFKDENGQLISQEPVTLDARTREAYALPDRYPAVQDRKGTMEFTASSLSVLELRFNPRAAFTTVNPVKK